MRALLIGTALFFGCGAPPIEKTTYGEYAPYEGDEDTGDTGAEEGNDESNASPRSLPEA